MVSTVKLGGTASDLTVAKVAHGLMMMTWRPTPISDEQAFGTIKAGVDALPAGVKMILNSGTFYGPNGTTLNLEMLAHFYEKFPEYADKTFLSVKGGNIPGSMVFDGSPENLRRSVDEVLTILHDTKEVDLFQPARIDPKYSIESIVKTLSELVHEDKFDHIGLSEVRAETLRRGNAIHPITMVEIEVSPTCYEEETKKVIATAAELDVAVAAYSPLGQGLLTGTITKQADIDPKDMRAGYIRFQEENLRHNLVIAEAIKTLAQKKGCTPAQLCIAWVGSLGEKVIPLPGSSQRERCLENLAGADIILTAEEQSEIKRVLEIHPVKGERYFGKDTSIDLLLWG